MTNITDDQITERFKAGERDVQALIAPLIELAEDSSSLVIGYGVVEAGVRSSMIPYFHVCGAYGSDKPVHVLVVAGWAGTEKVTPYVVARLIAALEDRLQLVAGIEVTAYPVANLEAYREGLYVAASQSVEALQCWTETSAAHMKVFERELDRYPYDLIILLRENTRTLETQVEAWLVEDEQKRILSDDLRRYASAGKNFGWEINPVYPTYRRSFTPIPGSKHQPAEIIIGLPSANASEAQTEEGVGLVLSLAHAIRQARQEGLF